VRRNPHFTEDCIARFQSTLIHLQARLWFHISKLPARLQTFHSGALTVSDAEIALLPRSLTDISLGYSNLTGECLKHLPSCLRSLTIHIDFITSSSPYCFLSSLETLDVIHLELSAIQGATKLSKVRARRITGNLDDSQWSCFGSLTSLEVHGPSLEPRQALFEALSPNLTALNFIPSSPFPSSWLPRNLTKLRMQEAEIPLDEFLASLPPTLLDLYLLSRSFTSVSSLGIALLPRQLQRLTLLPCHEITDDAILHLPPHLITLHLTGSARDSKMQNLKLTDACVAHLPRRLAMLTLGPCPNMTEASLPHFPRTLLHLSVARLNLPPKQIRSEGPPLFTTKPYELFEEHLTSLSSD
jgi:hypothetical protein